MTDTTVTPCHHNSYLNSCTDNMRLINAKDGSDRIVYRWRSRGTVSPPRRLWTWQSVDSHSLSRVLWAGFYPANQHYLKIHKKDVLLRYLFKSLRYWFQLCNTLFLEWGARLKSFIFMRFCSGVLMIHKWRTKVSFLEWMWETHEHFGAH